MQKQKQSTVISQQYELVAIDKITAHPENPRKGDIEAIKKSVAKNGFYGAVVVQRASGHILAGRHRWDAAKAEGLAKIPVIWLDIDDKAAKRILLADNRTSDLGTYEQELLAEILLEMRASEELEGTGYGELEVGNLLKEMGDAIIAEQEATIEAQGAELAAAEGGEEKPEGAAQDEELEIPAVPVTQPGDKWLLGGHVLLCGDATKAKDVKRLMDGHKAQLVFTDPPYNVAYEGYTDQKLTIEGDKMTPAQFKDFLAATFVSYKVATLPSASLYVCHPSSFQREFQTAMEAAGIEIRTQIIWVKNTFAWGFARYKFSHEPIFYAHHKGESDAWYGDKTQSTTWEVNKPSANRLHPTMKPVELIHRAILNSSQPGELVIDFFGGSGSTLVAAESLNRLCRTMELDPRYCDVIVRRWQQMTGKAARREDGTPFDMPMAVAS